MASAIREVAAGVGHLQVAIANVYFVGAPGEPWALVDTSIPGKAKVIREAAEARYGRGAKPEAILLTHGHGDHSGSARELAEQWQVPILAHKLEAPYLTGKSNYPPPDTTLPGFMSMMARFFRPTIVDLGGRLQAFETGELPGMRGWEWHLTPGHAPGHAVFFRASDRTLLGGDACTTVNVDSLIAILRKQQRVSRPPTPINYDWGACRESVRFMADLRPNALACGHGVPMMGEAARAGLDALAKDFPIPERGRYVAEPARVDENGIVYLPPAPGDKMPQVANARR